VFAAQRRWGETAQENKQRKQQANKTNNELIYCFYRLFVVYVFFVFVFTLLWFSLALFVHLGPFIVLSYVASSTDP